MKPLLVYGARPNFIKIAPIYREMRRHEDVDPVLVHTGQHCDSSMSAEIIAALELPLADLQLDVGPGSQPWQIGTIMTRLEGVYEDVTRTTRLSLATLTRHWRQRLSQTCWVSLWPM